MNNCNWAEPYGGTVVKNPLAKAGDTRDLGSIPGFGWSSGTGNGNPLRYSYLENSLDKGAWQATVHGVAKSWTWLSMRACTQTHTHTHTQHPMGSSWDRPSPHVLCPPLLCRKGVFSKPPWVTKAWLKNKWLNRCKHLVIKQLLGERNW